MQQSQLSNRERAEFIRQLLESDGWREVQVPTVVGKVEQAKSQMLLDPDDRLAEFKKWSIDKFAGFVMGLNWGLIANPDWLNRWNAEMQAFQQATAPPEPRGFRSGGDITDPSENGASIAEVVDGESGT